MAEHALQTRPVLRRGRTVQRSPVVTLLNGKADAEQAIKAKLQLIAQIDTDAAEASFRRAATVAEIAKLMHDNGFELDAAVFGSGYKAVIENTKSNSKKEIDPKVLFKELKRLGREEDFWDVIKVQLGATEKVLTEREVNTIATHTPAKITGTAITVEPLKKKK